jgi:predicted TIM-barrel fold metal-dependent hydrolase
MRWEHFETSSGAYSHWMASSRVGEPSTPKITTQRWFRRDDGSYPVDDSVDARLADLDANGIWAETVLPNLAMEIWGIFDREMGLAHARAYNDYLAETFHSHADRFMPLAVVPVLDIDDAVTEVNRAIGSLGLRGVMLPITPPKPYFRELYHPV